MAEIIEMPKLSDTMQEGVIAAWHKKVGDTVSSGELLAEVETDKATMELESFYDGTLLYVAAGDGGSIPIGELMAIIGNKGENVDQLIADYKAKKGGKAAAPAAKPEAEKVAEVAVSNAATAVDSHAEAVVSNGNGSRTKASPLAKAMAKEQGIDIAHLAGTGDGGRIVKRDIEAFLESGGAAAAGQPAFSGAAVGREGYRDEVASQMRKTIARRLAESKFTAPHFYLTMEIDMAYAWKVREDLNAVSPVKLSFNDLIVKACASALKKHPAVNASWLGDRIRYYDHVHIGVAVAVPDGLIVPVVRFADSKGLAQISTETKALAEKARDKKLQPADWEGNTFTISNLGMFGIEEFTAIINPPDACILAVGAIRDVPVVKEGQIVPGKTMKVTMSCDHRVVDGAVGSAFLQTLKGYLENPARILI
ncbi:MAG: pyruvate dehydrogenase complex dihydrolipoamide acetyltransferase [Bacteroidia bacterium]|nr:pyruvate dehydrogenase complex dihydrolipoamide acetyltransferase [Bacteroidia bacterium]